MIRCCQALVKQFCFSYDDFSSNTQLSILSPFLFVIFTVTWFRLEWQANVC